MVKRSGPNGDRDRGSRRVVGVDGAGGTDLGEVAAHCHHPEVLGGELVLQVVRIDLPAHGVAPPSCRIVYGQEPRVPIIPRRVVLRPVESRVVGVSGMGAGSRGGNDLAPQVAQLNSLLKNAPDAKDRHQRSTTVELSALGSCSCLRVAGKEGCEQLGRTCRVHHL
jgi:hypothetical protein